MPKHHTEALAFAVTDGVSFDASTMLRLVKPDSDGWMLVLVAEPAPAAEWPGFDAVALALDVCCDAWSDQPRQVIDAELLSCFAVVHRTLRSEREAFGSGGDEEGLIGLTAVAVSPDAAIVVQSQPGRVMLVSAAGVQAMPAWPEWGADPGGSAGGALGGGTARRPGVRHWETQPGDMLVTCDAWTARSTRDLESRGRAVIGALPDLSSEAALDVLLVAAAHSGQHTAYGVVIPLGQLPGDMTVATAQPHA
ncbi:MAG: hypothetical protein ACR2J8_05060, partial [Thermomicrobiales bacterium]